MPEMIIDGVNAAHQYGLFVTRHETFLPPLRRNMIEIVGRDGAWDFGNNTYGLRKLRMEAGFESTSIAVARAQLRTLSVLLSKKVTVSFTDEADKYYTNCRVYDVGEIEDFDTGADFELSFDCDPYLATNEITASVDSSQDYGSACIFYPVITATKGTGSASSLAVYLESTGEIVTVVDSLVEGDVLTFDMAAGKVSKNSISCISKIPIESTFFGVTPGLQKIGVTVVGAYTASMTYRKRYL